MSTGRPVLKVAPPVADLPTREDEAMGETSHRPPLPPGRVVDLPGRGRTFVRELTASAGAPALLLLHGWTANADLNWCASFVELSGLGHVVAMDHRGHGQGIRDARPFCLEDCADDAAALASTLAPRPVVAIGYSMGGAVAQLLWRRHRDALAGLVLCATSRNFNGTPRERAVFSLLSGVSVTARRVGVDQRDRLARRLMGARRADPELWRWAGEDLARHDWLRVLEAGRAIGRFDSRPWARTIDVPTAVVTTLNDRIVPARRQFQLAAAVPGATVHPVAGDHDVCLTGPEEFVPALVGAVESVLRRAAVSLVLPVPAVGQRTEASTARAARATASP